MRLIRPAFALALPFFLTACGDTSSAPVGKDPQTAPKASIDRFSAAAGMLMVRTPQNGLPAPNQPVDFDQGPFITQGWGPQGQVVRYYNFDVKSTTTAPIFVLFREGESTPVAGQLNVVDAIPGDAGYNDFWQVTKVTVPAHYVANTITSLDEIRAAGYVLTPMDMLVNCPIVPDGSTARVRLAGASADLTSGWYRGQVVKYFTFAEAALVLESGKVPLSPIFVTFNTNPDQPGGGPPSGFETQAGTLQTHNVVATLPGDPGYSPLWDVSVYDNTDFAMVSNLATARAAHRLADGVAMVNCPIVSM